MVKHIDQAQDGLPIQPQPVRARLRGDQRGEKKMKVLRKIKIEILKRNWRGGREESLEEQLGKI
jgi:hypothetical protein